MRINLSKFCEILPEPAEYYQKYLTPGIFRAIDSAINYSDSRQVDWGSFTYAEAELALADAMAYVGYVGDEEMDYGQHEENTGNAIHEFLHSVEATFAFKQLVPLKNSKDIQFF